MMPDQGRILWIFGNGLSEGFDSRLSLPKVSQRALEKLQADRVAVLELLAELASRESGDRPVVVDKLNFEELAGPLDRLADALLAIDLLIQVSRGGPRLDSLQQASSALRAEYLTVVGTVLKSIDDCCHITAKGGGQDGGLVDDRKKAWDQMNAFVRAVVQSDKPRAPLIFTLNYDSLLMSSLLETEGQVYDGYPYGELDSALNWWERGPALFHLHGSVSWVMRGETAMKADLDTETRVPGGLLARWAAGDSSEGWPVVVLSDLKSRQVRRSPFNLFYARLEQELSIRPVSAVIVAGYGFRDLPLNRMLFEYLGRSDARLVVGTRDPAAIAERVRRAFREIHAGSEPDRKRLRCLAVRLPTPEAAGSLLGAARD